MRTTQQPNINLVYAIGIPTVIAFGALVISSIYLIGFWLYSTYLEPKTPIVEVSQSRKELEAKHRELLAKSGFKDDVNLKSVSDEALKTANRKLETALRAGK